LPEAHVLIQAFNAVARIAAPAMLFKSEAIVHPDDVVKYIGATECQLSYNPLLMALLWNTLATRKVRLLSYSMRSRFKIPHGCAWVNYVRVHTERPQIMAAYHLQQHGFTHECVDLLTGATFLPECDLTLEPYQLVCLSVKK
jgi:hypothetical protein